MGGAIAVVNSPVDDRPLIEAAQADPSRFTELYSRNVDLVFAHALYRCGDRSLAEEVTSEVFFRALRALPRFEWRGVPYLAYLRRIADNVVTDIWRRDRRESLTDVDEAATQLPEQDDELLSLVSRLPEDQRRVLALRFAEDLSIAQVASDLGRSEGAVKQLQHRALTSLRSWLTDPATKEDQ